MVKPFKRRGVMLFDLNIVRLQGEMVKFCK